MYHFTHFIAMYVFWIQVAIQIFLSGYFFVKTKNLKSLVSPWLHCMIFLPTMTGVCYALLFEYYLNKDTVGLIQASLSLIAKITLVINFGYLIRMVRVQV